MTELTDFSLAESSNMRSRGFLTGSSANTCSHMEKYISKPNLIISHTQANTQEFLASNFLLVIFSLLQIKNCNGDLVNGWMPLGLPLRGCVQPPEGGETASALTEGTRHGLASLRFAAFCTSRHL